MRPCLRCLHKNQTQFCIDAPPNTPGPIDAKDSYSSHEDPGCPSQPTTAGEPMLFPFAQVLGGPTPMAYNHYGPLEPRKRRRVVVDRACTACRRSKKKCDGALPCSRCSTVRRESCSYNPDPAAGAAGAAVAPLRPRVCECASARSCTCFETQRDSAAGVPPLLLSPSAPFAASFAAATGAPLPPCISQPPPCSAAEPTAVRGGGDRDGGDRDGPSAPASLAADTGAPSICPSRWSAAEPTAGRGGGDGIHDGAALAALLPFAEVGWRPADAARWLAGLPPALRGALREAGGVARLAASFDALQRGPFAPGPSGGGGEGSDDDDAGLAAARAFEGHPTVGVFWARCAGNCHAGRGNGRVDNVGGGGGGGGLGGGGRVHAKADAGRRDGRAVGAARSGTGGTARGGDGAAGGGGGAGRYANERFAAMLGLDRRDL